MRKLWMVLAPGVLAFILLLIIVGQFDWSRRTAPGLAVGEPGDVGAAAGAEKPTPFSHAPGSLDSAIGAPENDARLPSEAEASVVAGRESETLDVSQLTVRPVRVAPVLGSPSDRLRLSGAIRNRTGGRIRLTRFRVFLLDPAGDVVDDWSCSPLSELRDEDRLCWGGVESPDLPPGYATDFSFDISIWPSVARSDTARVVIGYRASRFD